MTGDLGSGLSAPENPIGRPCVSTTSLAREFRKYVHGSETESVLDVHFSGELVGQIGMGRSRLPAPCASSLKGVSARGNIKLRTARFNSLGGEHDHHQSCFPSQVFF